MTWGQGPGQGQEYAAQAPSAGAPAAAPASARATGRSQLRSWLLAGVIVVGFGLAAVVLSVYYGATLGLVTTLLAIVLAAIPLGIVIPTFLWLDRFEAEPTRYLVTAFLWGALVAALLAGIFNTGANIAFQAATGREEDAMLATAVFSAPLVEEASKGLLVLLIWWFRRREFDGIIDGMVYAGVVAAGFAFTENIQYLGMAYDSGGDAALTGTFIARCLFTPFAHPMFTILTGIGIGIAATARQRALKVLAPIGGYLLAVLSHAVWNLAAITGGAGMLSVYLVVEVPIFVGFVALVVWARRREGRLIGRHLSEYADAGWLSPSEVQMLSTMSGRRSARLWARTSGGGAMLRSMRTFQDSASELALLRARMHHSAADARALDTEQQLLQTLTASRRAFLGAY
ncbi:Membrane proteinase PrsW, cleaves anti-sigma factor RsiW, M82 family [Pedococcus dokdonensis]|uniref:Membrane proteinase PrsW, cleaves anti-sigma factor RsiW, M82 family n=1 Tax=Pedococcus dokdonensis TaxID=443156 RepID=A0A1H0QK27_9MICO|nr:PrsW family intramembrane metalloprotease [Pedococcus dokdonensis]SDP17550.1 Membrane proteinase PrsW, cleaves anti-sigma factor RsiW, M82 family [Pedococcus dokdonensis]